MLAPASTGRSPSEPLAALPAIVRPSRCAIAAASVRLAALSLPRMFETWTLTVFGGDEQLGGDLPVAAAPPQAAPAPRARARSGRQRAAATRAAVPLGRANPRSPAQDRRARLCSGAAPSMSAAASAQLPLAPRPPGRPPRPAPRRGASAPARSRRRSPRRTRPRPPASAPGALSPFARLCSASALASQPRPSTPSADAGHRAGSPPRPWRSPAADRPASSTLARRAESPLSLAADGLVGERPRARPPRP